MKRALTLAFLVLSLSTLSFGSGQQGQSHDHGDSRSGRTAQSHGHQQQQQKKQPSRPQQKQKQQGHQQAGGTHWTQKTYGRSNTGTKGSSHPQPQRAGSRPSHNRTPTRASRVAAFRPPPVVVHQGTTHPFRNDPGDRSRPYRSGYTQYKRTFTDHDFWYPHYVYAYQAGCAPSPWYWYPNLPGFVALVSIRPVSGVVFNFMLGDPYAYRPFYYRDFDENRLDTVADRLVLSFRDGDFDRMAWLVDSDADVQIQVGDYDDYDLRGEDCRAMMRDMVHDTRTVSYEVTSVRQWRGGGSISARHVYEDPWGERRTVMHYYGLRETPQGYRIVSLRTSLQ